MFSFIKNDWSIVHSTIVNLNLIVKTVTVIITLWFYYFIIVIKVEQLTLHCFTVKVKVDEKSNIILLDVPLRKIVSPHAL